MPVHSIMFCLDFRSGLSNLLLDNIRRLISFVSVFVSVCVFVYAFDDLPRFPQLSNGTLWRHPARPQLVRPHIPPTLVSLCVTVGELRTSFHCHSTSSQPPTPPPWSQGSPTTPTTPPTDPTYYPSRPPDSDSIHTLIFIFIESKTEAFAIRWPAQFQTIFFCKIVTQSWSATPGYQLKTSATLRSGSLGPGSSFISSSIYTECINVRRSHAS